MNIKEREGALRKQLLLKAERNENLKTIDHTMNQIKNDLSDSVYEVLNKLTEQLSNLS